MIELLVLIGTYLQKASVPTNFVIIEAPYAYNIILGRPTLNQARAVVSTYSLVVKFLTLRGAKILHYAHYDPLVITLTITNYLVKRVLVDTGSSSDILFIIAFD